MFNVQRSMFNVQCSMFEETSWPRLGVASPPPGATCRPAPPRAAELQVSMMTYAFLPSAPSELIKAIIKLTLWDGNRRLMSPHSISTVEVGFATCPRKRGHGTRWALMRIYLFLKNFG